MENPDNRIKTETSENDDKILKTAYKHNDRIKIKYICNINKRHGKLTYERKKDFKIREGKKPTICFMLKTYLKIKELRKLKIKRKSKEMANEYRH